MKWLVSIVGALLLYTPTIAQEFAPDQLIRSVTNEVMEIVRKDKDIQTGNTRKAINLVETKVLPHFDFARMTRLALAKDWKQASPAQQITLADEFRILLVRTYSKALSEYRNQTVDFKPFKMQPGETDVKVRTQIEQAGAKPIGLDYYLEKQANGWKIYDIEVGGVSLITNYRGEFSTQVREGGIEGLIAALKAKNKGSEGTTASKK